jgi:hypothetical protein
MTAGSSAPTRTAGASGSAVKSLWISAMGARTVRATAAQAVAANRSLVNTAAPSQSFSSLATCSTL